MKLRNKKTGQEGNFIINKDHFECVDLEYVPEYKSLAELNEEWEDYKPVEPLIKDEKIRKAVRAWADANGLSEKLRVINEHFNCCKIIGYTDGGTPSCDIIEFGTTIAGADKGYYYTIAELCGEEEG